MRDAVSYKIGRGGIVLRRQRVSGAVCDSRAQAARERRQTTTVVTLG